MTRRDIPIALVLHSASIQARVSSLVHNHVVFEPRGIKEGISNKGRSVYVNSLPLPIPAMPLYLLHWVPYASLPHKHFEIENKNIEDLIPVICFSTVRIICHHLQAVQVKHIQNMPENLGR